MDGGKGDETNLHPPRDGWGLKPSVGEERVGIEPETRHLAHRITEAPIDESADGGR